MSNFQFNISPNQKLALFFIFLLCAEIELENLRGFFVGLGVVDGTGAGVVIGPGAGVVFVVGPSVVGCGGAFEVSSPKSKSKDYLCNEQNNCNMT